MHRFGLEPEAGQRIGRLSENAKWRLALARTAVVAESILVAEDTHSVPTGTIDQVVGLLPDGATLLLLTHRATEAERLCDVVTLIVNGVAIVTGAPEAIVAASGIPARVRVSRHSCALRSATLRALAALDGALSVDEWPDAVVVHAWDPAVVVAELTRWGVEPQSITVRRGRLEDVLADMTGRWKPTRAKP